MKKMTEIFAYILGASHITSGVECYVPEKVDERTIFFGPCKRNLRKKLRARFLIDSDAQNISDLEIHLMGFNASNPEKDRRIVWIGKAVRIMTFERALSFFKARGRIPETLHLEPLYKNGQFNGYKHVGEFHAQDSEWVWDIVNKRRTKVMNLFSVKDSELVLKDVQYKQKVLELDCCLVCDNLFFAGNGFGGIKITKRMVDIFKEAQPKKEINDYYIFGPKGSRGFTLHLKGDIAERLVNELLIRTDV
jgi:hypothetical protein